LQGYNYQNQLSLQINILIRARRTLCNLKSKIGNRKLTMHILVTNDDGVTAPGLLALAQEMRKLGTVTVFAPDKNWSASGHVKTMERPLRVRETTLADGTNAFTSDGAPSDCVALSLLGIHQEQIDLVVSGINPHANIGHDITYSGTVTAAMEAVITGVKGIAVSLDSPDGFKGLLDYSCAASVARRVVEKVIADGLPKDVVVNINVPYLKENELKGFMITRQGLRVYRDALDIRNDPRGRPYYWIGGEAPTGVDEPGTDFGALKAGYVSITPLQLDLTNYKSMDVLGKWEF
jgi:5'-nucleotidase